MSVRLHPKHGLNPTIPVCIFCGKDRNEVVLLGAAYKKEAPMHMVVDAKPCDACAADMAKGIALIEAKEPDRFLPPSKRTVRPTGRFIVITEEGARRMFHETVLPGILQYQKCFIEPEAFEKILSDAQETGALPQE